MELKHGNLTKIKNQNFYGWKWIFEIVEMLKIRENRKNARRDPRRIEQKGKTETQDSSNNFLKQDKQDLQDIGKPD